MIENEVIKVIHEEVDTMVRMSQDNDSETSGVIYIEMIRNYILKNNLAESAGPYLDQPVDVLLEIERDSNILFGSYSPMRSPGVLALYQDNIRNFFWGAVWDVLSVNSGIWIFPSDLKHTAEALVFKVWWHEQFHFCCDVFRQLFGSSSDTLLEEALAVAYSRQRLHNIRSSGKTKVSRIHPLFYSEIIRRTYAYTSPGYRDWSNYSDPEMFNQALIQYVLNHGKKLDHNGVDLSKLLMDMISSFLSVYQNGYVEKLL